MASSNVPDYFWTIGKRIIFTTRCQISDHSFIGRVSYEESTTSSFNFIGRRYAKTSQTVSTLGENESFVSALPSDYCMLVPFTSIAGTLSARSASPIALMDSPSARLIHDTLTKELAISKHDLALAGSRLINQSAAEGDFDFILYDESKIDRLKGYVNQSISKGFARKLRYHEDPNDQMRMQIFGIDTPHISKMRQNQWFRRILFPSGLISFSFGPPRGIEEFQVYDQEFELLCKIVDASMSLISPFTYHVASDDLPSITRVLTFAWFFRGAFTQGQIVRVRGTVVKIDGQFGIMVRNHGHFIRPLA